MSEPTQPPAPSISSPFKVGDRVRYKKEMRGNWPEATITEITECGFRYEYDEPFVLGTRIGSSPGGEAYESSFDLWEIVPPPCPNHCGHGPEFISNGVCEKRIGVECSDPWGEECGHHCAPEAGERVNKTTPVLLSNFSDDEHNALYSALIECGMDDAIDRQAEPHENSVYLWLEHTPKTTITVQLIAMLHRLGFQVKRN